MSSSIDKIIDNIYIGNYEAAMDPEIIMKYKIQLIVNCTKKLDKISEYMEYINIPINDPPEDADIQFLNNNFYIFVPAINKTIDMGKNILFHCNLGSQRSPTVVAIYMMVKFGLDYQSVVTFLQAKRPICFFGKINFLDSLIFVQKQVELMKLLEKSGHNNNFMSMNNMSMNHMSMNQMAQMIPDDIENDGTIHISHKKKKNVKLSLPNIILFDTDDEFIAEADRLKKYAIKIVKEDVNDLLNSYQVTALVSASNSFCYMNEGADRQYTDMFMNIEQKVQNRLKAVGVMTRSGKLHLPVGSAMTVPTNNSKCPFIICSPIMFNQGKLPKSDTILFAFVSIIYLAISNKSSMIAFPKIGKKDNKFVIDQIELALNNYEDMIKNHNYTSLIKFSDKMNVILYKSPCQDNDNNSFA